MNKTISLGLATVSFDKLIPLVTEHIMVRRIVLTFWIVFFVLASSSHGLTPSKRQRVFRDNQGSIAAVIEREVRSDFNQRWSVVGSPGSGKTTEVWSAFGEASDIVFGSAWLR